MCQWIIIDGCCISSGMLHLHTTYPADQGKIHFECSPVSAADVIQALQDYIGAGSSTGIPNLPFDVPLDITAIGMFYEILSNEDDRVLKTRRALAHRMFKFDGADLWWLMQSKPTTGFENCHTALQDIKNRWREQVFRLRMGRYWVCVFFAILF